MRASDGAGRGDYDRERDGHADRPGRAMRRERKIVIGTLALGCILGLVLWVTGSGAEPAQSRPVHDAARAPRAPEAPAELSERRQAPYHDHLPSSPLSRPPSARRPPGSPARSETLTVDSRSGPEWVWVAPLMKEGEESVPEWIEVWADTAGRYRFRATPGWKVRLWADSSSSVATLVPTFEVQPGKTTSRPSTSSRAPRSQGGSATSRELRSRMSFSTSGPP